MSQVSDYWSGLQAARDGNMDEAGRLLLLAFVGPHARVSALAGEALTKHLGVTVGEPAPQAVAVPNE